jgi:cytochrome c-type biogenesis protein CcmH/NrfF
MNTSRRSFIQYAALGILPVLGQGGVTQDTTKKQAGGVTPDRLGEPMLGGRIVDSTDKRDNDAGIIAIERRLRCRCGCMLDVYTCRTTDFVCTVSPAMHREVIALIEAKKTPEQVIQAFIASDGEKVLMSPPASGFNIAGYIVPGLSVAVIGLVLAAYLSRRRAVAVAAGVGDVPGAATPVGGPDQEQLDRLKRALDEVES